MVDFINNERTDVIRLSTKKVVLNYKNGTFECYVDQIVVLTDDKFGFIMIDEHNVEEMRFVRSDELSGFHMFLKKKEA